MTLKQLMSSVASLGFESEISDTAHFNEAVRRALDVMYVDREITRCVTVNRHFPILSRVIPSYLHLGGDRSTALKLNGRATAFITSGTGSYTVFDGDRTYTENFSGTAVHKLFISDGAIITFYGNHSYTVSEIALYASTVSDDEDDIPLFSDLSEIKLKDLPHDYVSLAKEVTDIYGEELPTVCEGDVIKLKKAHTGALKLTYRCKAPDINALAAEAKIDIPGELEALLPFITASFLWLDDDADKAQYYMAIYRDMITSLNLSRRGTQSTKYTTDGWA